jgi:hypothetical protein
MVIVYAKIAPQMTPTDFLYEDSCAFWKFGEAGRYASSVAKLLCFIYEGTLHDQKLLSCFG